MSYPDPSDPQHYGQSMFRPRLWHGMTTWAWWRLIRGHLVSISPSRYGLAFSVTFFSLFNSLWAIMERLIFEARLKKVKVEQQPVLILGFQRSGTTYLNELLACDPRFAYPDNLQCFHPECFLVTEKLLRPLAKLISPEKRPMDDVELGLDAPQEEEIALLLSGIASPYRAIAFPSAEEAFQNSFEQEVQNEMTSKKWNTAWLRFLKKVQFVHPGKRLLLKSPTNTVRIEQILRSFPDAKFIHITRDPYKLYLSNLKLRLALTAVHGLQHPTFVTDEMRDALLAGFVRFHEMFEEGKKAIPEGQLVSVAYEDLVRDPRAILQQVYQDLDLGDWAPVDAPLSEYLKLREDYKTNVYTSDAETVALITDRWGMYFDAYGYVRQDLGTQNNDSNLSAETGHA